MGLSVLHRDVRTVQEESSHVIVCYRRRGLETLLLAACLRAENIKAQ